MNEEQKRQSADEQADAQTPDLSLMFAPSWARQSPDATVRQATRVARSGADSDGRPQTRSHDRDRIRSPRPRGDGPPRATDPGGRPPRRDSSFGDARPPLRGPRPEGRGDVRAPAFAPRPEPQKPLPLDIRFLPEQKALGTIIRRIQTTRRAYPVKDIVRLFQNSDESMLVRIEATQEAKDDIQLFQCRVCGMPALGEEEVRGHLLRQHLEDFFEAEAIEGEAPTGNFSCIARCGLSGELLGPPNHHSFGLRVQEMLREHYPKMSEEEYRGRLEMVRDPEAVEAWREANRRQKLYRRKVETPAESPAPAGAAASADEQPPSAEPAAEPETAAPPRPPAVERHIAELQFNREIVPQQIGSASHLVCPATALKNLPNRRLAALLSDRFNEEAQRHGSLFYAVHGAFRHRGLYFFRAGDARGPEFVMGTKPAPMDTTHVVARLRDILTFVATNPSCAQQALIDALAPTDDVAARADLATQVQWLVEKGHLVEFFNGMLTIPAEFPVFRSQPKAPKGDAPSRAPRASKPPVKPQHAAPAAPPVSDTDEPVPAAEKPAATQEPRAAEPDENASESAIDNQTADVKVTDAETPQQ